LNFIIKQLSVLVSISLHAVMQLQTLDVIAEPRCVDPSYLSVAVCHQDGWRGIIILCQGQVEDVATDMGWCSDMTLSEDVGGVMVTRAVRHIEVTDDN